MHLKGIKILLSDHVINQEEQSKLTIQKKKKEKKIYEIRRHK